MARVSRTSITLCALLFTTLSLTLMAHVPKQARKSSITTHTTEKADKKKSAVTTKKTQKTAEEAVSKSTTKSKAAPSAKKSSIITSEDTKARSKHVINKAASVSFTEKCTKRKGYKSHCAKAKNAASGTLTNTYKAEVQEATKVAMNKLMQQVGKPYCQDSSSPRTGFDCSGLVYYTYKDSVKIRIPRTTNEIYHLCGATSIKRSELKNGDLTFFRTQGCSTADHIGVHVGNDKSVQSPCTGQEIQVISPSEDY